MAAVAAAAVDNLCDKLWRFDLDASPEFRTYSGIDPAAKDLDDYSFEFYERRKKFALEILSDVEKIKDSVDLASLDATRRTSLLMIETGARTCHEGLLYEPYLVPINYFEGPENYFKFYTRPRMHFDTKSDFELYLRRIGQFPRQVDQIIELLKEGAKKGIVPARVSVEPGAVKRMADGASVSAEEHLFYQPFLTLPTSLTSEEKEYLKQTANSLINDVIKPSFGKLHEFLKTTYVPKLRTSYSVDSIPGRSGRYETMLKFHCDVDWSPQKVHELGLREVAKLHERLQKVMSKVGFSGTFKEFRSFIHEKRDLFFKTEEEIIPYCEEVFESVIKPSIKPLFGDVPELPMAFEEHRGAIVARGVYNNPPHDGSKPGILRVTVSRPTEFAKYEVLCFMLHESAPGHHFQACFVRGNSDLPLFRKVKDDRKYFEVPGRFLMNSAFCEGWGLYCEELGEELGLYERDPYDEYGYIGYNMIRSARVVVDTGIHALGWSHEEAVEYLENNTSLTRQSAVNEVDRYITWPAHSPAYKIGHLKIRELRDEAEKRLGEKFDVKEFHRQCLVNGQVPLSVLEEVIQNYISSVTPV